MALTWTEFLCWESLDTRLCAISPAPIASADVAQSLFSQIQTEDRAKVVMCDVRYVPICTRMSNVLFLFMDSWVSHLKWGRLGMLKTTLSKSLLLNELYFWDVHSYTLSIVQFIRLPFPSKFITENHLLMQFECSETERVYRSFAVCHVRTCNCGTYSDFVLSFTWLTNVLSAYVCVVTWSQLHSVPAAIQQT